jgi:hypothetical protein
VEVAVLTRLLSVVTPEPILRRHEPRIQLVPRGQLWVDQHPGLDVAPVLEPELTLVRRRVDKHLSPAGAQQAAFVGSDHGLGTVP